MPKFLRLFSTTFSLILLAVVIAGFWKHQAIEDWWRLRNYTPPAAIVSLAQQTTMVPSSERLFYVNRPELNDKISFNSNCEHTEHSIVLGCFVSQKGIFLLDVQDERLKGVEEVTAAHELLHAAYERLSRQEREWVDGLTAAFFATLDDDRIKDTVEQYREKDSSIVPNELHSILGTEVRELSPELEAYYARYFKDRSKIVAFSEAYEAAFIGPRNKVKAFDAQLESLKITIENNKQRLDAEAEGLSSERQRLENLARNDPDTYNAVYQQYNSRVVQYNALIAETRSLINQYNSIIEQRNALVGEEQELVQAIDSRSLEAPINQR